MVSIYDWFGYDVSIENRYKLIKEAGFDGVLLWWSDGFGRGAYYRDGVKHARNADLIIENIHTPVQEQDNLSFDNLDGESLFNCYLQCIKDCAEFDIPTMVVHLPDNGGVRGQHQLPLDGNICWSTVMKKISETEYTGATALEPMNWGYENLSIQEFLCKAYKKVKELEKMRLD